MGDLPPTRWRRIRLPCGWHHIDEVRQSGWREPRMLHHLQTAAGRPKALDPMIPFPVACCRRLPPGWLLPRQRAVEEAGSSLMIKVKVDRVKRQNRGAPHSSAGKIISFRIHASYMCATTLVYTLNDLRMRLCASSSLARRPPFASLLSLRPPPPLAFASCSICIWRCFAASFAAMAHGDRCVSTPGVCVRVP